MKWYYIVLSILGVFYIIKTIFNIIRYYLVALIIEVINKGQVYNRISALEEILKEMEKK